MKNCKTKFSIIKLSLFVLLTLFLINTNIFIYAESEVSEPPSLPIEEPTETSTKILFIGNSSTYYNNMPEMLKGIATASGKSVEIDSITASGYKLSQYVTEGNLYNTQIIDKFKNNTWDYVVLQDHREVIIQKPWKTETSILKLKEYIDSTDTQIVLYETQADYEGREFNINNTSIFLDNLSAQYYMTRNYFNIGNSLNTLVSTSGVNYTRCMNLYPEIALYDEDKLHPSPYGSYLAACSLYGTLFNSTAFGNEFLPESEYDTTGVLKDLDAESLLKIQNIADATLTLTQNKIELVKGTSQEITATFNISEENTSLDGFKNIPEYFSLNDSTVSVNRVNGTVTALNPGETMVMATTDSGLMAMYNVNVIQPATSFTITETSTAKVHKNDTFTYTTNLLPKDTTDKITWVSSDPTVVSIDENGTVTAKKVGVAKITAMTDSGLTLTRHVRVKLATPTNIKVKKLSTKTKGKKYANIKLSWKKNKNAVCYYVYRSTKKGSGYKKIATTTTPKYIDKNRKKGKTFYYKIRSVYSNTKCNSDRNTGVKFTLTK